MRKIQKRNFINRIFGNQRPQNSQQLITVQMLNSYNSRITNYNNDLYDDDTVRACIDTIARHFAKMQPVHRMKGNTVNDNLNILLNYRPNPDMSTYDFLYKVATCYEMDNNAYIYIKRDNIGNVIALYPFSYSQTELKKDKYDQLYLEFTFSTGQKITASVDNVVVLRKHFYKSDFFGESNRTPLYPIINLLHTINEGIINAVKSSAFIRGILKATGMLQDEDVKANRDLFKDQFLSAQNNGGIIVTDGTSEYTPIESKPQMVDDKQMALVKDKIYSYFGISESIIKGTYSENEWQAFYEGVLESLAIQLSQELTAKLFTSREIGFGNEIIFVTDRISYMSTASKISMINAVKDLGIITKGTLCDILNIERPSDADTIMQSLNYIDISIANQYQLQSQQDKLTGLNNSAKGGETDNEENSGSKGNPDESNSDQSSGE